MTMVRIRSIILSALISLSGPAAAHADGGPIMPLSEVQAGMDCTGETVVQGTTISSFNVHVIDVVQYPPAGLRILIRASGPAVAAGGIAQGFSGSPVYCPDATGTLENAGAISEGVGQFGNDVALVTPIEQMLGEPVLPPVDAPRLAARARPLAGPLMVGGLSGPWTRLLARSARRAGREVLAAPATGDGAPPYPPQQLVPGASVAVAYSAGSVAIGAVGTVTYRNGPNVYAFGHEMDGAGRRALLLQDAYIYDVIDNPSPGQDSSYKLAIAGHTLGTLTGDTPNAVLGVVGAPPPLIPVTVVAHDLQTGRTLTFADEVADETDVGVPLGSSLLDVVAPLTVGQAATQIYGGAPANESGRMCVTVGLRESRMPLRFCNRYVGTGAAGDLNGPPELGLSAAGDLSQALGLIDSVQFAALHVNGVRAEIDAERGLAEATLLSAHAPARVRAGARARVQLRVRLYRGPVRDLSFMLRIPHGAHGALSAKLGAAGTLPGGGLLTQLAQQLTAALSGGSSGGSGPSSIADLRRQFAATSVYDGLDVRFKGHAPAHAYRNDALLIQGHATLRFDVRR